MMQPHEFAATREKEMSRPPRLGRVQLQIMQVLWKLDKAFVKDIVDELPEPKPIFDRGGNASTRV